jgi:hypothetical protein
VPAGRPENATILLADGRVGLGFGEVLGGRIVGVGVEAAGIGEAGTLAVTVALEHAAAVVSAAAIKPTRKAELRGPRRHVRLT